MRRALFRKADGGYALTSMYASGSDGHYDGIGGTDPKQTAYWNRQQGAIASQIGIYNSGELSSMVQHAMDQGCLGAMGFNVSSSGIHSVLGFASSPLLNVSQSVK